MFKNILLVGLGGFLGTIIRFLFYQIIKSQESYPVTFLINVIGSLIIGIIIALNLKHGINDQWKLFLATGVCGGFTTFSSFSIENLQLIQQGKFGLSLLLILSSVFISIIAAYIGYKIAN
jgi:CrcB protein